MIRLKNKFAEMAATTYSAENIQTVLDNVFIEKGKKEKKEKSQICQRIKYLIRVFN